MSTQHVLVTGANRGLGLEFVRQYLADGATVTATVRDPAEARELAELQTRVGERLTVEPLDLLDGDAIDALAARLSDCAIDVLIHNAGYMTRHDFGHSAWADFETHFRINSYAPLRLAEAFARQVAQSTERKFVTLSSLLGSVAANDSGGLYAYRASKAAANAILKSLSIDLRNRGITVLALHPGWVRTRMGGANAPLDAPTSVAGLRQVIAKASLANSGDFLQWDGRTLPW